jgi:hypothetical protein
MLGFVIYLKNNFRYLKIEYIFEIGIKNCFEQENKSCIKMINLCLEIAEIPKHAKIRYFQD